MGAAEALAHPGEARVLASFPRALYVATPSGIAAFVAPGVEPGPLHVVLDAAPTREAARVGLAGVPLWRGELPDPGSLAAALPLALEVLAPIAEGNLVPAERAAAAVRGNAAAAESAARALGGNGHPSGAAFAQGLSWGLRLCPGRGFSQGAHSKRRPSPTLPSRY